MSTKPVLFKVATTLLEQVLRMDPSMTIVGARCRDGIVEFKVHTPDAPADAVEMQPHYGRTAGQDPIFLAGVDWVFPDGSTVSQPVGLPEPVKDAA